MVSAEGLRYSDPSVRGQRSNRSSACVAAGARRPRRQGVARGLPFRRPVPEFLIDATAPDDRLLPVPGVVDPVDVVFEPGAADESPDWLRDRFGPMLPS
jgi:hypothetical protein